MKREVPTEEQSTRLQEAAENLRDIQRKISPFVKHTDLSACSTSGKWYKASTWLQTHGKDSSDSGVPSC
jgi:hypothetical protein